MSCVSASTRAGATKASSATGRAATLPVRAMKRLIQLKVSPWERLQTVAFDRDLHRVDSRDAGDRINQRLEFAVFTERTAGLTLDVFGKVHGRGRAVDADAQDARSGWEANRRDSVGRARDRLDGGVEDGIMQMLRRALVRLARMQRNSHRAQRAAVELGVVNGNGLAVARRSL